MTKKLAIVAMVTLLVRTASAATYGTVDAKLISISPRLNMASWIVPYDSSWYTGSTGQFNLELTNASFGVPALQTRAFCIEAETTSVGSTTNYNVTDLFEGPVGSGPSDTSQGPMGTGKADAIRELWGRFISQVNSNITAAAFQLAVWELVYEDLYVPSPPGWDVTSGNFKARDDGGNTTTAINQANSWLSQIDGTGPQPVLYGLIRDGKQDLVVIPEPVTLSLLILGGVGLLLKRRK